MKSSVFLIILVFISFFGFAQIKAVLPYYEIPPASDHFSAGTVAARIIDGLGFRYYWATDSLRPEDLAFTPGPDSRTSLETLDHIHDLSRIIANSVLMKENLPGVAKSQMSFEEMRKSTLENFSTAANMLRESSDEDFEKFNLVFRRDDSTRTFPFWNQLNGPIADALWHVGQVVTLRRLSGNPFTNKVSVFNGTVSN